MDPTTYADRTHFQCQRGGLTGGNCHVYCLSAYQRRSATLRNELGK